MKTSPLTLGFFCALAVPPKGGTGSKNSFYSPSFVHYSTKNHSDYIEQIYFSSSGGNRKQKYKGRVFPALFSYSKIKPFPFPFFLKNHKPNIYFTQLGVNYSLLVIIHQFICFCNIFIFIAEDNLRIVCWVGNCKPFAV